MKINLIKIITNNTTLIIIKNEKALIILRNKFFKLFLLIFK